MDFLLDDDSNHSSDDEKIKNQLLKELDERHSQYDNQSVFDQRSVLDESFYRNINEDNETFQTNTWQEFMKGNKEREQILQGIEKQLEQVKKITQGGNQIEIDDELNLGQKKIININPDTLKSEQIHQIKQRINEEQQRPSIIKEVDLEDSLNMSFISIKSQISLKSTGSTVKQNLNPSALKNNLDFEKKKDNQSRFLSRNSQIVERINIKNHEQEHKLAQVKEQLQRERENMQMEFEDQRSMEIEFQYQKHLFRLRNYQLCDQFPIYNEQISPTPLISLGVDELPSIKRIDMEQFTIMDLTEENLASKNSNEITTFNLKQISQKSWFVIPKLENSRKAIKLLEPAYKLDQPKIKLQNKKDIVQSINEVIGYKDKWLELNNKRAFNTEIECCYQIIESIHNELLERQIKQNKQLILKRISQEILKVQNAYKSYKTPYNIYENALPTDVFKSFDKSGHEQIDLDMKQEITDIASYVQTNIQNIQTRKLEIKMEGLKSLNGIQFFKNLTQIVFSSNMIKQVDNSISQCQLIIEVNLSQNQIEKYEAIGYLKNLRTLSLEMNNIKKMQPLKECLYLEYYNLNGNYISQIQNLENLIYLKKLILFKNQLNTISGLQNQFYLEDLDLGSNQLNSYQGDNPFINCFNLRNLYLYNNNLSKLPKKLALPLLSDFWVQQNGLENLDGLYYLPALQNLFAQDNQLIDCISTKNQITYLPSLKKLNISRNKISSFGSIRNLLKFSQNIRELDYTDNPFMNIQSQQVLQLQQLMLMKINPNIQQINQSGQIRNDDFEFLQQKFQYILDENELINLNFQTWNKMQILISNLELNYQAMNKLKQLSQRKLLGLHEFAYTESYKQFYTLNDIEFLLQNKSLTDIKKMKLHPILISIRKFELQHKYSIQKVKKFLKNWIKFVRRRNQHYKNNIDKIIQIQALHRGNLVRRRTNIQQRIKQIRFESNARYALKIQKAFRLFRFKKRKIEALKNVHYQDKEIDEMEEFNDDFFNKPINLDYDLKIPNGIDIAQIFSMGVQQQNHGNIKLQNKNSLQIDSIVTQNKLQCNNFLNEDQNSQKKNFIKKQMTQNNIEQDALSEKQLALSKYSNKSEQLPQTQQIKKPQQTISQQKIMEDWGFSNPEVAKAFAYKLERDKHRKEKSKQKTLTAEQRFQQFQKLSKR